MLQVILLVLKKKFNNVFKLGTCSILKATYK